MLFDRGNPNRALLFKYGLMITKENQTHYLCEYCNKRYIRKHHCANHENLCGKNPDNHRPCLSCVHLEKKPCKTYFSYGTEYGQAEGVVDVLHCSKLEKFVFTPFNEKRGNIYELFEENNPMPLTCDSYLFTF